MLETGKAFMSQGRLDVAFECLTEALAIYHQVRKGTREREGERGEKREREDRKRERTEKREGRERQRKERREERREERGGKRKQKERTLLLFPFLTHLISFSFSLPLGVWSYAPRRCLLLLYPRCRSLPRWRRTTSSDSPKESSYYL
jgi:hypothetical protein